MRLTPLLSCLLLVACPALARAQLTSERPRAEAVRFQYAGSPECPDEAAFVARVRERTLRGRLAEEGELARTFNVKVAIETRGWGGSIEFLDDSGQSVSRRVHGEQCDAVVTSLALITALALDASLRPDEPEIIEPVPAAQREPGPSAPSAPTPAPALKPRPRLPARTLRARVGASGDYDAPIRAFSAGLLGELDFRSGMTLRFSAHYGSADRTVDAGRRANLQLLALETSFCPRRLEASVLALYPCLALDAGSLRASGIVEGNLTSGGSATRFWAALGPGLRVAWEPAAPFWLELHGRLQFPLVAREFVFEQPHARVFEIPRVAAGAGVATGVRFW